jgi:thiol-disulfide isomerase/thioredoxin
VMMSRRQLGLVLVAPVLAPAQAGATGIERLREETRPVPALSFTDAAGAAHDFSRFAGRGLVVNLWATWCPPCVAEMPALDRLAAMVADEGIEVLALSSDRCGTPVVEAFYQRLGLRNLSIWLDPRAAAARALGARGLPTTVLIDRSGQERGRLVGEAEWDAPPLVAAVRRLAGAGGA